ncbi:M28 family peptidase [Tahibacter amnicola]|uniref:Carboxypeptidase Q n=1 Tax=Tahibacter amnicola TaxID=2976241 RepID=A0ABY6BLZ3_9GAMM|nr:M28 family peptidase [Tahibacter amnicola]UXI68832.1 M28 family peptidase [Tahibacter amnicola]
MLRALPIALAAVLPQAADARTAPMTTIPDAAVKTAVTLRDDAGRDDTAYELLRSLTSEIGARLAGSENDLRAREWAVARFKALGYDKVWTEPVTYPRWVRRSESAALVAPYRHTLAVTALGNSPATPREGLTAEVALFDSLDALKAAPAEAVKDKIVFVSVRMKAHRDGHDYGKGSRVRSRGPALAAEKGAAGFVLRSAGTDSNRFPHTGVTTWDAKGRQIPAAAISNPDADLLETVIRQGQPVQLSLNLDCGLDGEYTGANVIAEITGSQKPEEIIILGGHLDSWDLGTGAIDDGAGVAISMAAGALIGQLPQAPRRTVRVVAFANEEAGLYGGKAYFAAHQAELSRHVLGSEADFGGDRIWKLDASVKPEALAAVDQMMQVLGPLGVIRGDERAHGGPDLSPMHAAGMAAMNLVQDGTRYFDLHHTANDTFDKIDPAQLAQNVAVYAAWAYMAAEADGDFGSRAGAFKNGVEEH